MSAQQTIQDLPDRKEASAYSMERRAERRREVRSTVERPVYVQQADFQGVQFEEVQTMSNHSYDGLYFKTESEAYARGMMLNVVPSFGNLNLEFVGEVVRIESLPGRKKGSPCGC